MFFPDSEEKGFGKKKKSGRVLVGFWEKEKVGEGSMIREWRELDTGLVYAKVERENGVRSFLSRDGERFLTIIALLVFQLWSF